MLICFIVCLAMNLIHQSSQTSNEIKYSEILSDFAIYLSLIPSYIFSKEKSVILILLVSMLSVDLMSYSQLTQEQYIYLSYSISYLLAGIAVLTLFPQYKMTVFSFIIMAHYQLFMAISYYLAKDLGLYEMAKSFMFVNYKAFLYGIHLLIIGSITRWTILLKLRIHIDYYVRVLWIKLGAYFVG